MVKAFLEALLKTSYCEEYSTPSIYSVGNSLGEIKLVNVNKQTGSKTVYCQTRYATLAPETGKTSKILRATSTHC